ncbi:hypothetical protein GW927_00530 [Candidatus Pacearchaeota archaeon]|nr:hypothetical protein [Candidatus Pacearchaeota archaeon]
MEQNTKRFGFIFSLLTVLLTIITFGIAIVTPPLSGPFCQVDCFAYPYTEIISRFPRDYFWMYPAMALSIVTMILFICLHLEASKEKKVFSLTALIFVIISSSVLLMNYFVQISVVQPSLLLGETDGISLLTQFNPHGLFIIFEELAYILLALAFIFTGSVFGSNRLEKALRIVFQFNGIFVLLSFIGISVYYGLQREYRFEVLSISITWLTLIINGSLLSKYFKKS